MLFLWGGKKTMEVKNNINNGTKNTNIDSDLPDYIVFNECKTTMAELYKEASDPDLDKPVIKQSLKYPHIACVRGTNDGDDVATDMKRFFGIADKNWESHIKQIKDYLQERPEITDLIGHSLGGGTAAEAIKDMGGRVKTVGVDAARVLNSSGIRNTRNINSDSSFDTTLDPYSPEEVYHPISNYFTGKTGGVKAGHNAWVLGYTKKFKRQKANRMGSISGYRDGKVRVANH